MQSVCYYNAELVQCIILTACSYLIFKTLITWLDVLNNKVTIIIDFTVCGRVFLLTLVAFFHLVSGSFHQHLGCDVDILNHSGLLVIAMACAVIRGWRA